MIVVNPLKIETISIVWLPVSSLLTLVRGPFEPDFHYFLITKDMYTHGGTGDAEDIVCRVC